MDFNWSEMMLVGIVALIVIGPKDLPGMFRELGRFTAKIRLMGREFSRAMEQAAKESGVKDATDGLKTLSNPVGTGLGAVKNAADRFEKWDPIKNAATPSKPLTPPPMPTAGPTAAPAAAAPVATATAEAPAAPAAAAPAKPAAEMGPATAALYEKKAARKAVLDEASAKLKALDQPETPAPAPKAPGRRRKTAAKPAGEEA